MPLGSGVRLGPYRIESPIGAGGMGEVYRARDTRLDRTVAIKLLAADIAADPQFRERFDREARTISSLDHPNICTLFDIGHDDAAGVDYLVMQHLEGETLADRLANGVPVPVDQALRYAMQMAAALDAAHRAGVVHRDLKPANVMITKSGIKLLDFGVAKRLGARASTAGGATIAATQAPPLTEKGSLLGTLQYMSPEQLEDGDVDARSDTFSFGAVLYEILTGQRAFEGKSQASVIAGILNADPPPLAALAVPKTRLPSAAQRTLDRLLRKCLAKNPNDRWQSTADLADELRWIDEERLRGEQATDARVAGRPRTRERMWMAAAAVAGLIAVTVAAREFLRPPAPPPPMITFTIEAPDQQPFADGANVLAMSPDGRRVAFLAGSDRRRLWVRSLDSPAAHVLAGTEGASQPSWSPDSRFLLFNVGPGGSKLMKVDIIGGAPTTVTDFAGGRSAWSPAGVIVFQARGGELRRIDEGGGDATPVTALEKDEIGHVWPAFLSDGRRFLYEARTAGSSQTTLNLGSIDSLSRTRLDGDFHSNIDYASGHVLYSRDGRLTTQPFDEKAVRLTGSPTSVVEHLLFNADNGRTAFSESTNGVLAYRTGVDVSTVDLVWYDRTGQLFGTVGDTAAYFTPRLSPDGRRLAIARRDAAHTDLWIVDLDRGISTRLTADSSDNRYPVWSPDGTQLFFESNRKGPGDLYVRQAAGAGPEELLYASPEDKFPTGVSPDGRLLLFDRITRGTKRRESSDIWALPLQGDRTPFPVVATPSNDANAVFSPDGRWIAYESNESGRFQVYVQPFPTTGARIQLSSAAGFIPAWTADSRRVVYAAVGPHLMEVDLAPSGRELRPARPRELPVPSLGGPGRLFAMTANAERFLVPRLPTTKAATPITVVVNWRNALKK
jgi:Tol biopolymer transport system component